jgi:ribonuclease III
VTRSGQDRSALRLPDEDDVALEQRLGYTFLDPSWLEAALTHTSAMKVGHPRVGEQLEFLGDAVLDAAIADLLLCAYPHFDEGTLSKRRAMLVQTTALAAKARQLGIGEVLRLGRGEDRSGGRDKDSILAWTYEAVLGAIYRDGGFERAKAVVARQFAEDLERSAVSSTGDWKTELQERTQAEQRVVPEYRLVGESGPAHKRIFSVEVWVGDRCLATGQGTSKRQAEQQAARAALEPAAEARRAPDARPGDVAPQDDET